MVLHVQPCCPPRGYRKLFQGVEATGEGWHPSLAFYVKWFPVLVEQQTNLYTCK